MSARSRSAISNCRERLDRESLLAGETPSATHGVENPVKVSSGFRRHVPVGGEADRKPDVPPSAAVRPNAPPIGAVVIGVAAPLLRRPFDGPVLQVVR